MKPKFGICLPPYCKLVTTFENSGLKIFFLFNLLIKIHDLTNRDKIHEFIKGYFYPSSHKFGDLLGKWKLATNVKFQLNILKKNKETWGGNTK